MYILGKNIKAIGKTNRKSTPKNENISKIRLQHNLGRDCAIYIRYRTISANIVLLIFAIEQSRPRLCYIHSRQNNFGRDCAIYIRGRSISAEIVLYIFAVDQFRPRLCYRIRRQNRKVRDCATAFGDRTEKYETVLPHSEIEQKSTKLCYRIQRQNRKVRNCATAFRDSTEKYEIKLSSKIIGKLVKKNTAGSRSSFQRLLCFQTRQSSIRTHNSLVSRQRA